MIATTANGRGVTLRVTSRAPVNRIELFDLAGRKAGGGTYGPLDGKTIVAGNRRSKGAGVTVVRLTAGDGQRVADRHLGKAVVVW